MRNYEAFFVHIICIEDKASSSERKEKRVVMKMITSMGISLKLITHVE